MRCFLYSCCLLPLGPPASALELAGLSVTPHVRSAELRYRRPPEPGLGARVELFLRHDGPAPLAVGAGHPVSFDQRTPAELLTRGDWAWHDTPAARPTESVVVPPGALMVWSFNSRSSAWGAGTRHEMALGTGAEARPIALSLDAPQAWLSAVTFLGEENSVTPHRAVVHVTNASDQPLPLRRCRLWLPRRPAEFRVLHPQPWLAPLNFFPADGVIPPRSKGGFTVETGPLPLTYAAVEVRTGAGDNPGTSLWAHLRIKREVFDLGGGWVASKFGDRNALHSEAYLRTLRRLHINAGMHQQVAGYSDTPLFDRYPLKYTNRLRPMERYDTDEMLPRIHAVEFLGEPQFGGGKPVTPQAVFEAFLPYGPTRLPTSVTHSEERVWRLYAGLSDYPHYDAYRVCAPAADAWTLYDRWGGESLRWGAPLETIGDLTRSLRDLNRPRPIAYWSQGAHDGWRGSGGRTRTSPTPEELRAQAYHALAHRITSLYWFNLSVKSLVKFRDLLDPIRRVNREIRLLEELLLAGDAFEYRRERTGGRPDWDLASVAAPEGAVCFALDLAYQPDPAEKVFRFVPRDGQFTFQLPPHLPAPAEVFRVDADGAHDVVSSVSDGRLTVHDRVFVVGVYFIAPRAGRRAELQQKHASLLAYERAFGFDPAANDADFATLKNVLAQ